MLWIFRTKNRRMKSLWWAIIIVTVVTFVGGFVFAVGSGFSTGFRGMDPTAVGEVNGQPIPRQEYANALAQQEELYRTQFGSDPGEREAKLLQLQAWRAVVAQHIFAQRAEKLGLEAYDPEVVLAMKSTPPQVLLTAPAFQTEGQFDPNKYAQALGDPSINWSPFEEMARQQIPVRKLQERLVASLKVSEPELLQAFRNRNETVDATVLQILPSFDEQTVEVGPAEIDAAYEANRGRFAAPRRVQLEVMLVPKRYGDAEVQATRDLAVSLAQRARNGEDFAQLARDFSEDPTAQNGGTMNRPFLPSEFGAQLAPAIEQADIGDVLEPFQDGGRFTVFKILYRDESVEARSQARVTVAQIVLKVRPDAETLQAQYQELLELRRRAAKVGLSQVATENGFATTTTQFFGYSNPPPALFTVPDAADWGLVADEGDVGPVFEGIDEFAIVQVATVREAGPAPKEDLVDQVRQLAEMKARVDNAKPRADEAAAGVASGKSLTQVARDMGLNTFAVDGMTRESPDGRVAGSPEVVAAMFAGPIGRTTGPIRSLNGWYFVHVDARTPADMDSFEVKKPELTQEILQQRQTTFLDGLMVQLRRDAEVEDRRYGE